MVQYTFLIYIQLDSFIPPAKKNIALFCCLFIKSKKIAIGKDSECLCKQNAYQYYVSVIPVHVPYLLKGFHILQHYR